MVTQSCFPSTKIVGLYICQEDVFMRVTWVTNWWFQPVRLDHSQVGLKIGNIWNHHHLPPLTGFIPHLHQLQMFSHGEWDVHHQCQLLWRYSAGHLSKQTPPSKVRVTSWWTLMEDDCHFTVSGDVQGVAPIAFCQGLGGWSHVH